MDSSILSQVPPILNPIKHYLKTASEHDGRDPVVSYYCRLYAAQKALEIDKKSPECRQFITALMDSLEKNKKANSENEGMKNETIAHAHFEQYALKLFLYADNEDRAGKFGKNVVKAFYTAGMLFDVLEIFGELSEEIDKNRKYAKWKATYIHKCLKSGVKPSPGPQEFEEEHQNMQNVPSIPSVIDKPEIIPSPKQSPVVDKKKPSNNFVPHKEVENNPQLLPSSSGAGAQLKATDYQKAIKFCKYASSALQYEDSKTAIDNLNKALNLLTTGHE